MKVIQKIGIVAILSLFAGFLIAPVLADPPPWAPAHGWRAKHDAPKKHMKHYRYHYYPHQQVYFLPERGTYFWLDGGVWRMGVSLPTAIRVYPRDRVILDLEDERPYRSHPEIMLRFPLD